MKDWDNFYSVIDPEYERKQEEQRSLFKKVKEALPSEETKKAFRDYENRWVDGMTTRQAACFLLGAEASHRLFNPLCR